jgi:hypothetical protein
MAPPRAVGILPGMSTAVTARIAPAADLTPERDCGVYVTDGHRLFRVVSPGRSLFPCAELEDCLTLEVDRYFSDELYEMRLQRVVPLAG